jgi:hypothetical protein
MYKYILESAGDIDWLALIPLVIFFVFFTMTIIRVVMTKKSYIEKMEQLPFEEDTSLDVR